MSEKEEQRTAVRARLDRVVATQERSPVLEPDTLVEVRRLTATLSDDDADPESRYLLGWVHWHRFQALPAGHDREDLAAAVDMFTACLIAGVDDIPANLLPIVAEQALPAAVALHQQGLATTDLAALSAAVDLWLRILRAAHDDDPNKVIVMSNLANALRARFERTGVLSDLEAAIAAGQSVMQATPDGHPEGAGRLAHLSKALRLRFERTGDLSDLDAGIEAGRSSVQATPDGHPERATRLSNLGVDLAVRFERTGMVADVDAAIETSRSAAQLTPHDHPQCTVRLANLGHALRARFERTQVAADLDAAVEYLDAAVRAIPDGNPEHAGSLFHLGDALRTRFERTGVLSDLDAAVEAARSAVQATPDGHPDRAGLWSNLGAVLQARFGRTGVLSDVNAAVEAARSAVQATPEGHPDLIRVLSNLGNVLRARYEHIGDWSDLDSAIEAARSAVEAAPEDHPYRAIFLTNLSVALRVRFGRTGMPADGDAAVEAARSAVEAAPEGHPHRASILSNLSTSLQFRSRLTGALPDLDAAIDAGWSSVRAAPDDHPHRASLWSNLGAVLQVRFERTGDLSDVNAAVEAARSAVQATPEGHPGRAAILSNLGFALAARLKKTGRRADLDMALSAHTRAVQVGSAPPAVRIRAAREAAHLAMPADPGQAAGLLEAAVLLLPEMAPRQMHRADQQFAIGRYDMLAGDAAALALSDTRATSEQRATRALRLLEAGRAVLLSQALDTRNDLTDLRQRHPALAVRFVEIRDRLDQNSLPPALSDLTEAQDTAQPHRPVHDRHHLAVEMADILAEIRAIEGFGSFALPPTTDELLAEAASGPIVTFNISSYGSDALLLTQHGITSLPLPDLAAEAVIEKVDTFHRAVHSATDPAADRKAAQATILRVLEWLWDAAAAPVLDALGSSIEHSADDAQLPRVWWALGGILGLLPMHAAGYHGDPAGDPARRSVLDRVVSSYTPTIRGLRYARQRRAAAATPGRTLIVAMPTTPGLSDQGRLDNVLAEAAMLHARLPRPLQLTEPGTSEDQSGTPSELIPTKANVFTHLPDCSIAHFACHGANDPTDPSQSLLLLHDYQTDPLTVASLAPIQLDRVQLAYLSACTTAITINSKLMDEAIHLATAFQLAGIPHVIGTLWEINDHLAVTFAETFYTGLQTGPDTLEISQAPYALHHAVRAIRDRFPRSPSLWAAYVHAGA
ncbi:MAG TPA: CHAT domain-containing protein [Actinomadura sp.]|jgi:hypothetical protein|nr:CHAT domain-containing protein [Actinomadura sp.]